MMHEIDELGRDSELVIGYDGSMFRYLLRARRPYGNKGDYVEMALYPSAPLGKIASQLREFSDVILNAKKKKEAADAPCAYIH